MKGGSTTIRDRYATQVGKRSKNKVRNKLKKLGEIWKATAAGHVTTNRDQTET